MNAVIQVLGSLLVLVPFVVVQTGRLTTGHPVYLLLNVAGSGILAVDALIGAQWGFLLLEGVWAVVSLGGLGRVLVPWVRSRSMRSHRASDGWSGEGLSAGRGRRSPRARRADRRSRGR